MELLDGFHKEAIFSCESCLNLTLFRFQVMRFKVEESSFYFVKQNTKQTTL